MRDRLRKKSLRLKGFGDGWVNWQRWRERGDEREERGLVRERVSTMEREMRDHGERELMFTNKILIYFLQLSYSVILHLESHYSTIANFFAILELYKFR